MTAVTSGDGHAASSSGASSVGGQSSRTASAHGSGVADNIVVGDFVHSISIGNMHRPTSIKANFCSLLQLPAFHEKTHSNAGLRHWSIIARVYY